MNTIALNDRQYTCPSTWAEMQSKHLLIWAQIINKDLTTPDAFGLATMLFYGIDPKVYFALSSAQQVQLIDTLHFLAEPNGLNNWLIETVKPRPWLTYYGPSARLATSTIQEFRFAEIYYTAYQRDKKPEYLDQLIATLYRRKGNNNLKLDCRTQLSQLLINNQAGKMKHLSPALRNAIVFNYEGCRAYIFKKYANIFKASTSKTTSNELPDLEGIIKTVAGGKFGNYLQTEDTALYIFLNHLSDEIDNAEKQKRS